MKREVILNVFPGASETNRLVLARTTTMCGLEHLVLRQETHAPDVGWFIQNQVAIEPAQVAALKMTLSPAASRSTPPVRRTVANSPSCVDGANNRTSDNSHPIILQFEVAG